MWSKPKMMAVPSVNHSTLEQADVHVHVDIPLKNMMFFFFPLPLLTWALHCPVPTLSYFLQLPEMEFWDINFKIDFVPLYLQSLLLLDFKEKPYWF
jgi:hypothetical protein